MADGGFQLEYIFPLHIRKRINITEYKKNLEEIRVRVGQPIELIQSTGTSYLTLTAETDTDKTTTCTAHTDAGSMRMSHTAAVSAEAVRRSEKCTAGTAVQPYIAAARDITEMVNYISKYSLYAYKEELKQGYITLEGGHRVGMAGGAAAEGGRLTGIWPVTFLNIRVAHEKKGCADSVLPYLYHEHGIYNTLFFSAPGAGKTTVLRDCIRLLSDGTPERSGMKVCVVDERAEIAASHVGVPQNDVGARTDVLSGCEKPAGIQLLLRAMSPQVLAVDELGNDEDFHAVEQAAYCGCSVVGTVHAGDICELCQKPQLKKAMEKGMFGRYIGIQKRAGGARTYQIYNAGLERLC